MEKDKDGDRKQEETSPMKSPRTPRRFYRRSQGQSSRSTPYQPVPWQGTPRQSRTLRTIQIETSQSESSQSEWHTPSSGSEIDPSETLQSNIQQAGPSQTVPQPSTPTQRSIPLQYLPWQSAPQQTVSRQFAPPQTLLWRSAPPQIKSRRFTPLRSRSQQPWQYTPMHSHQWQHPTWHPATMQPEQTVRYQPRRLLQSLSQEHAPSQPEGWQPPPQQTEGWQHPSQQTEGWQHSSQQTEGWQHSSQQTEGWQHPSQQTEGWQHSSQQTEGWQHSSQQTEGWQHSSQQTEGWQRSSQQTEGWQHPSQQTKGWQHPPYQTEGWQHPPYQTEGWQHPPYQTEGWQHPPQQTEVWQPGPSQLGPSQPGPSQPGPSQPGPSQPGPSQPGPSQPGLSQPGTSQHESSLIVTYEPDVSQPGPSQPERYYLTPRPSRSRMLRRGSSLSRLQQSERERPVRRSQSLKRGYEEVKDYSTKGKTDKDSPPYKRPTKQSKFDNTCKEITLLANYFKVLSPVNWTLYLYNVEFTPPENRVYMRKGLIKLYKTSFNVFIYDGHVLYLHERLPNMTLPTKKTSDGEDVTASIRYIGIVDTRDRHYLQFFNIIMRKCLEHLKLQLVRRNYYDPIDKKRIDQYKLEVLSGIFTSIRQHKENILMCVDITHKIMRLDTLLDIWYNCKRNKSDGKTKIRQMFCEEVIGCIVLTDHNNNTYRIRDVDFTLTPMDTFILSKTGESIRFKDYYQNRYNITLKKIKQPMLLAEGKQKTRNLPSQRENLVYLIPELCRATGLTDSMRKNFSMMTELSLHTRIVPEKRIKKLMAFNQKLHDKSEALNELKQWGLQLENKLVEIQGRKLPMEQICFLDNDNTYAGEQGNWKINPLVSTIKLDKWMVLCEIECRDKWQEFMEILKSEAKKMRFEISYPHISCFKRKTDLNMEIENVAETTALQLVVCVDSKISYNNYTILKKKCCVDRPIPSQMIIMKERKANLLLSIAKKIAVQINCKLGGAPWYVNIPLKGLMVIGFDVCHDKRRKDCDFGATVASLDSNLSRYISAVSKHKKDEELSNDIASHICKFISAYRDNNGNRYPEYIIIYRDGVGEDQLELVYNHEVKKIKEKLDEIYKDMPIKMAFIIVTKRVNTRIFYNDDNPPCGTVVDSVITSPVKRDFFIVSQHVQQGTVTPTLYTIIYDTLDLNIEMIQQLTYKLTHMYYNWNGVIRVPAPCQYAHKLAYLVGVYIHQEPNVDMENLLYYL
ncbi:piwi-like protein Siwi isoform X3 [Vespula maculifrons]|uniref:Piwi-like protein Siwi isoform X3 n=1 Tax=Vespula maculifrons TaxID=7453 RepID=A0ABD2D2A4_VESMC